MVADLLLEEIGKLDRSIAERLQLGPDSSVFWSFAHDVIEIAGNTEVRLAVLTSLKRGRRHAPVRLQAGLSRKHG